MPCAQPNDPGHGPHYQLTQKIDGKAVTQDLPSPEAIRKAESEIAALNTLYFAAGAAGGAHGLFGAINGD